MRELYFVLDKNGDPRPERNPIAFAYWRANNHAACVLAKTRIDADAEVSTVFLGINHAHRGGPPVLWESMIFGGPLDGMQRRYTSRAPATKGHEEMVAQASYLLVVKPTAIPRGRKR